MSQVNGEGFEAVDANSSDAPDEVSEGQQKQGAQEGENGKGERAVLPEVTFATFVLSINTSALVHLGELEEPGAAEKKQDLLLAKHAIDTLVMLREKTEGNLTEEERNLVDHVIYDLRLRYVKASS